MKKTIYRTALFVVALVFGACESEFVPFHESTPKAGFVRWDAEVETLSFVLDLTREANPVFEGPLAAPADNVSNYALSFVLATAGGSFGPFDFIEIQSFPAMLSFSAQDIADVAGVSLENLKGRLDFNATVTREDGVIFTYSDLNGDAVNPGERQAFQFSVGLVCPSDLAGTFDYVSTSLFAAGSPCGSPSVTGTVTWTETGPGQYSTSDATFGQFADCYGDTPAVGLTVNDSCDLLSVSGSDQYGDSYSYKVISISGSTMTLEWENTFDDSGTVELTRQDGKDWPPLGS